MELYRSTGGRSVTFDRDEVLEELISTSRLRTSSISAIGRALISTNADERAYTFMGCAAFGVVDLRRCEQEHTVSHHSTRARERKLAFCDGLCACFGQLCGSLQAYSHLSLALFASDDLNCTVPRTAPTLSTAGWGHARLWLSSTAWRRIAARPRNC
jgi:hypothetical protein